MRQNKATRQEAAVAQLTPELSNQLIDIPYPMLLLQASAHRLTPGQQKLALPPAELAPAQARALARA